MMAQRLLGAPGHQDLVTGAGQSELEKFAQARISVNDENGLGGAASCRLVTRFLAHGFGRLSSYTGLDEVSLGQAHDRHPAHAESDGRQLPFHLPHGIPGPAHEASAFQKR